MPTEKLEQYSLVTRVVPLSSLLGDKGLLRFAVRLSGNWLAISPEKSPVNHFRTTGQPLFGFVTLFFGYSGEINMTPLLGNGEKHGGVTTVDTPSPSVAHVQWTNTPSHFGSTRLCESNRTWKQFGNRHLNRADGSENRPAQCPRNKHSGATLRACWSIRHCQRQSESRCSDHADVKPHIGVVRCCFVSVSFPSDGRLRL